MRNIMFVSSLMLVCILGCSTQDNQPAEQDLFRVQLTSPDTQRPMHIHALVMYLDGDVPIDVMSVRVNSADLPSSAYRLVPTAHYDGEVTIAFNDDDGLLVPASGVVLTVTRRSTL